jgi:two-component system CheB/CheR fusion protein
MTNRRKRPTRPASAAADPPATSCPIVGIGASAGGLDAFKKFFAAMPPDAGLAFVLIPHLDPTHDSLMVELLTKQTAMSVAEAADGTRILADHVYVIPPNKYLAVHDGVLQLSRPPTSRGQQTAIDFCLRSLAADQQERSIGIIFSGTGSHGTLGLKEIKFAGGMVMVQDPESAEYDQMPRSAIATGLVDYVLPPTAMPEALVRYVEHPYLNPSTVHAPGEDGASDQLNRILAVLRTNTKYDFRVYRKHMVKRRVQRRMGLCHIATFAEYEDYLCANAKEVTALYKDMLINVTGFFRDPEAFEVLSQRVVPELVERASADRAVRVWVPGCATGEEAYSLAILLVEGFRAADREINFQIFATDLDEDSLERARAGLYADSVVGDLSPARLRRFFTRADEQQYQAHKELRDAIVFAPQNLISDAPFSKLDLISCRNLLIYLEPKVQEKVVSLFHFSLNVDGYLLLGPSESIGRMPDLFEPISKKWRVYRRVGPVRREIVDIPIVAS